MFDGSMDDACVCVLVSVCVNGWRVCEYVCACMKGVVCATMHACVNGRVRVRRRVWCV